MSVIIIVPTYNERENIKPLFDGIFAALPDAHVLIVDDNSPDGTGNYVEELAAQEGLEVSVLHRAEKQGLGAAYVAAFKHVLATWPEAEFVIHMDADLSHDPAALPDLLEGAQDADLAVGSRYTDGVSVVNWPLRRLILSKLGSAYARLMTGLPLTDCTGGFKCYRMATLRALDLSRIKSNGYCFQIETNFRVWQMGLRVKDVPIVFYERKRGQSKINMNIAVEALLVVAQLGLERFKGRHGYRRSAE